MVSSEPLRTPPTYTVRNPVKFRLHWNVRILGIIFRAPVGSAHGNFMAITTLQNAPSGPDGYRVAAVIVVARLADLLHHDVPGFMTALVAIRPHWSYRRGAGLGRHDVFLFVVDLADRNSFDRTIVNGTNP